MLHCEAITPQPNLNSTFPFFYILSNGYTGCCRYGNCNYLNSNILNHLNRCIMKKSFFLLAIIALVGFIGIMSFKNIPASSTIKGWVTPKEAGRIHSRHMFLLKACLILWMWNQARTLLLYRHRSHTSRHRRKVLSLQKAVWLM